MRYCSECGAPVAHRIPQGDDRERAVCTACGTVHYRNPKLVVGCIPEWEDRLLLCRRAIEPRQGLWTLPAGFLEMGESVSEGAGRELQEEACATVSGLELFAMFDLVFVGQIYLMFRGPLTGPDFAPGEESLEAALFSEAEIPWKKMAFPVISETLKLYFADRAAGCFRIHSGRIERKSLENP